MACADGTTEPRPTADTPPPRPTLGAWHALVFDEARAEVLLVNGVPENARDERPLELWSWDGTRWEPVIADPDGPVGRNFAGVAYDTARDVLVVHGGQAGGRPLEDTLEWDGTTWRETSGDGPGPRSAPAMTYDASAEVVVLYGGDAGGPVYGDTWTWDGATWREVATDGPDPVRWPAMFAYDAGRSEIVLYGGHQVVDPDLPPSVADTWVWDGTGWRLAEAGSAPGALVNAAGYYSPELGRLVLAGGSNMTEPTGDAWTWSGETWERIAEGAFPPRQASGLAYDPLREVAVLTGGVVTPGEALRYQDLWEWDETTAAATRASPGD